MFIRRSRSVDTQLHVFVCVYDSPKTLKQRCGGQTSAKIGVAPVDPSAKIGIEPVDP